MNKYIPDTQLMRLWMPILVYTVFIFSTARSFIPTIPTLWNGVSSLSWPQTEGIVVAKDLVKKPVSKGTLWRPHVVYRYSVAGKDYSGKNIAFYYFFFGREWAEKEVQGYETGKAVTVYYKSSNPGVSCLNPGSNKWAIIFGPSTFLGIVFFTVLIIRLLRKEYPRPAKAEQA